jgi:hypothetical protein
MEGKTSQGPVDPRVIEIRDAGTPVFIRGAVRPKNLS